MGITTTNRLLTVEQAAAYLGLSKLTMYDWISQRKIEFVKIGRLVKFDQRVLDKWIDQHTIKPRQEASGSLWRAPGPTQEALKPRSVTDARSTHGTNKAA